MNSEHQKYVCIDKLQMQTEKQKQWCSQNFGKGWGEEGLEKNFQIKNSSNFKEFFCLGQYISKEE